jgi:UDPglucose 6-dehydrogenase
MIIGGSDPEGFWQDLFRSSLPNCKIFFNCTNAEASMAKYTINSFLALKVAFFNQVYDVCEESGLDYELVRQLVCNDIRIGPSHTAVPGMDGSRGFGGACFPKDTNSFTKYAENLNTPLGILESAVLYNKVIRQ